MLLIRGVNSLAKPNREWLSNGIGHLERAIAKGEPRAMTILGVIKVAGTPGYAERAGWVRPDDGILVRDLNGNGRIDNVTEMFGGATSGFAQLAALDGNQDGKVDANDNGLADFNGDGTVDANDTVASLQVWRDLNEDGVTQAGELFSLAALGIASISVAGTAQQDVFLAGNQITATGTFTRTNGSTGTIADVLYRVDNAYTQYAGDPIAITAHAAALPDHKGHGTLVSLRQAMSLDDNFATAVENTLPTLSALDLGSLRAANDDTPPWSGLRAAS